MQSICNSLSFKALSIFCDYKDKSVFKRVQTYMYENMFSLFMKSNKPISYYSICMTFFVNYFFLITSIITLVSVAFFFYGEIIQDFLNIFKIWCENKYNEGIS